MSSGDDNVNWAEVFAAFDAWTALAEDERGLWLAALTVARPLVQARVASLIQADAQAQGSHFLDPGACDSASTSLAGLAGQRLGPWLIDRLIGTGGMGQVWLAHRTDGRYDGQAAIKLMRMAVADAPANQRFAREGRMLGRLNHPNIARLLDAGSTESGERYLVLEYVEGERIDRWCDRQQLAPRERIALFLSVCAAVAHAHENLVVHRDLKPSNIFVAASGDVKLLDFGVAKLLEGESDATELTREAGAALTPRYAAPEQLAGRPVSTATDVYGLGVVLNGLIGAAHIGGDLGVVIGKATRDEPAERYGTVPEFADDLRRVLERRPVRARPDSLAYRTRRYLQRHSVGVGAAALVLLALALGLAGTLVKQREAEREAARAVAVKRFLLDLFEQARSSMQADGTQAREATVNDLLAAGARRVESELIAEPAIRDDVFQILIELYTDTGDPKVLLGLARRRLAVARAAFGGEDPRSVPAEVTMAGVLVNIGETEEAARLLAHAQAVLDRAGDRSSLWRARLLRWQGTLAQQTGAPPPSWEQHPIRLAVELLRKDHLGEDDEILSALAELPDLACRFGRTAEAMAAADDLQRRAVARYGGDNLFVDDAMFLRGKLLLLGGEAAAAVPVLEQALAGFRRHVGAKSPNVVVTQQVLAKAYLAAGREADFERVYAEARLTVERDLGDDKRAAAMLAQSDKSVAAIRAGKPPRCGDPR